MAAPQPPLSPMEAFTQLQAKIFSTIKAGSVPRLAEQCKASLLVVTAVCDEVLEAHNSDKHQRVARFMQAIINMVRVYKGEKSREMIRKFAGAIRAADTTGCSPHIQQLADQIGNYIIYYQEHIRIRTYNCVLN